MDLINDLETELAFAFLVEKRYQQKIDSKAALALIGRVKHLLEITAKRRSEPASSGPDGVRTASTH